MTSLHPYLPTRNSPAVHGLNTNLALQAHTENGYSYFKLWPMESKYNVMQEPYSGLTFPFLSKRDLVHDHAYEND